jgi:hypothetical protein
MSEWQPIETAPKDGTWFLAARRGEGPDQYEIGAYDPLMFAEYVEVEAGLFRKEMRPSYDWRGFNNFRRMTHWMPLPTPPS